VTEVPCSTVRTGHRHAIRDERTAYAGADCHEQHRPLSRARPEDGFTGSMRMSVIPHDNGTSELALQRLRDVGTSPAGDGVSSGAHTSRNRVYDSGCTNPDSTDLLVSSHVGSRPDHSLQNAVCTQACRG
jgi:hypothetical protein